MAGQPAGPVDTVDDDAKREALDAKREALVRLSDVARRLAETEADRDALFAERVEAITLARRAGLTRPVMAEALGLSTEMVDKVIRKNGLRFTD